MKHPDLQELANMHNVIMSSHVAFYTDESIRQIAQKTLNNFEGFLGQSELDEKCFVAWTCLNLDWTNCQIDVALIIFS